MEKLVKEIEITPIKVNELKTITHLRFEIDHDKGGVSWGTGDYHNTGVKLNVKPISRDPRYPNLYSVLYDGKTEHQGFFVFLCPCSRKSPKRMQKCADVILPMAEEMTDLFLKGDYVSIAKLAQEATKDI